MSDKPNPTPSPEALPHPNAEPGWFARDVQRASERVAEWNRREAGQAPPMVPSARERIDACYAAWISPDVGPDIETLHIEAMERAYRDGYAAARNEQSARKESLHTERAASAEADAIEPAPWARDAWFTLTTQGAGEGTSIHQGWEALCAAALAVHYHDPDPDQRDEVYAVLTDWEQWSHAPDGHPWILHLTYEDGNVSIERITDVAALRLGAPADKTTPRPWFLHDFTRAVRQAVTALDRLRNPSEEDVEYVARKMWEGNNDGQWPKNADDKTALIYRNDARAALRAAAAIITRDRE